MEPFGSLIGFVGVMGQSDDVVSLRSDRAAWWRDGPLRGMGIILCGVLGFSAVCGPFAGVAACGK